jgi:hypothetical protein
MRGFVFALAFAFLGTTGMAQQTAPKSEAVQIQDLPKAVVEALKAKFPDAQMEKAKKKVADGKEFLAISLTTKGTARNVTLTPKGKIVELKTVIPAAQLPAKVTEALYASYPNSTAKKAQKVTAYKEEKSFQVELITADKQTKKLVVNADGKIINGK